MGKVSPFAGDVRSSAPGARVRIANATPNDATYAHATATKLQIESASPIPTAHLTRDRSGRSKFFGDGLEMARVVDVRGRNLSRQHGRLLLETL